LEEWGHFYFGLTIGIELVEKYQIMAQNRFKELNIQNTLFELAM
jgi:hypothetical protein